MKELYFNAKMAAWVDDNGSKKLVIHATQQGVQTKVVVSFGEFQSELLSRETELPCA